jgi:hypothetical protein
MRYLRHILPVLLLFFACTGCKKSQATKPVTTAPIDTDAFIHHISFDAPDQFVATTVSGDTLRMIYYENVSLYIPKNGYTLSYALHLKEDFGDAILKNFQYITIDSEGDVDVDWVDDNLNNITAKTLKDTTINNLSVVQVTVKRPFTFSKVYASNQLAVNEMNSILKITTDEIIFSSYVYFTKTYQATSRNIPVYYVKAD